MCRGTDEASRHLALEKGATLFKGVNGGSMKKDQTGVVAVSPLEIVGILAIFCTMGEFTILTPSIAAFSHHFADTPTTTIMLANSITGMISVPVSILSGSLLPRVGFRRSAIIGVLIMSLAGAAPFLFPDIRDYSVVIASRMAVGVGLGILFPVGNATIIAFFEGERRSRLLGLGVTVQFLFALVYTTVAGVLTEIGWNYSFLTYLVGLVPLVVVVAFMPEARSFALTESSTLSSALCAIRYTPRAVWGYALFALAVWTCVTTVFRSSPRRFSTSEGWRARPNRRLSSIAAASARLSAAWRSLSFFDCSAPGFSGRLRRWPLRESCRACLRAMRSFMRQVCSCWVLAARRSSPPHKTP